MTVAKDPKLWIIPLVVSVLGGSGGIAGYDLWKPEPVPAKDPVLEYRIGLCERRGATVMTELATIKERIEKLPPDATDRQIERLEAEVRKIREALIRLEKHGHPSLQYGPVKE